MNEFNYEGWIGSIVGTYSSTSEFPIEGTPNAIYLVVDSGTAEAYVWDSEGNDYIQMSGGGGGGGTDANAVHYRGTVAQASDLPASPSKGDLYEATAAFTLGSDNIEAGDFIIYDNSNWKVIQGNLSGAVSGPSSASDGHLAVFDGTSGKVLKDGGAVPVQAQADWNQSDSTAADYIKNKPTIPAATDIWEVWRLRCEFVGNAYYIQGMIFKNGEIYTGNLYMKTYTEGGSGGTYGGQVYANGYSGFSFSISDPVKTNISFAVYLNQSDEQAGRGILISEVIMTPCASISSGDYGYVTGDQVNTVVGNIETLLAQI